MFKVTQSKIEDLLPLFLDKRHHSLKSYSVYEKGYVAGIYANHDHYVLRRIGDKYYQESVNGHFPTSQVEGAFPYLVSLHTGNKAQDDTSDQELIVFHLETTECLSIDLGFLKTKITSYHLNEHYVFGVAGQQFFSVDLQATVHRFYEAQSPLPEAHDPVAFFRVAHSIYVLFKSVTTRKLQVWNVEKGTLVFTFETTDQENLIYANIQKPGFVIATSAKNSYLWNLTKRPIATEPVITPLESPFSEIAVSDNYFVAGDFAGGLSIGDTTLGEILYTIKDNGTPHNTPMVSRRRKVGGASLSSKVAGLVIESGLAFKASHHGLDCVCLYDPSAPQIQVLENARIGTIVAKDGVYYARSQSKSKEQYIWVVKPAMDKLQKHFSRGDSAFLILINSSALRLNLPRCIHSVDNYIARDVLVYEMMTEAKQTYELVASAARTDLSRIKPVPGSERWRSALTSNSAVSVMVVSYLNYFLVDWLRESVRSVLQWVSCVGKGSLSDRVAVAQLLSMLIESITVAQGVPLHCRHLFHVVVSTYEASAKKKAQIPETLIFLLFCKRFICRHLRDIEGLFPEAKSLRPEQRAFFPLLALSLENIFECVTSFCSPLSSPASLDRRDCSVGLLSSSFLTPSQQTKLTSSLSKFLAALPLEGKVITEAEAPKEDLAPLWFSLSRLIALNARQLIKYTVKTDATLCATIKQFELEKRDYFRDHHPEATLESPCSEQEFLTLYLKRIAIKKEKAVRLIRIPSGSKKSQMKDSKRVLTTHFSLNSFPSAHAWLAAESTAHRFTILLFVPGGWSELSLEYLRVWSKVAKDVASLKGNLIALTNLAEKEVTSIAKEWCLTFSLLSDTNGSLCEALGLLGETERCTVPEPKLRICPDSLVVLSRSGEAVYVWQGIESFDSYGNMDRPKPKSVLGMCALLEK